MGRNLPTGDGYTKRGARDRSQRFNPRTNQWVKRDRGSGRAMDVKQVGASFKGVRKEG